jgi:uncharacterized protein YkwD
VHVELTRFLHSTVLILAGACLALLAVACGERVGASPSPRCSTDDDCTWGLVCGEGARCVPIRGAPDVGFDSGLPTVSWSPEGVDLQFPSVPADSTLAACGVSDIRTDDLNGYVDDYVPDSSLLHEPWSDSPGRCGDDIETTAWRLSNCERLARGLQPLACDLRLVWAGREHSMDMAARNYFAHQSPEGITSTDRLDSQGIEFLFAGENLAAWSDIVGAHRGWMASEEHRRNILNDQYSHAGVGAVRAADGRIMAVELFIRPTAAEQTASAQ